MKLLIGCKCLKPRDCEVDKPADGEPRVKGVFHSFTLNHLNPPSGCHQRSSRLRDDLHGSHFTTFTTNYTTATDNRKQFKAANDLKTSVVFDSGTQPVTSLLQEHF